ncbi:MAG: SOS response-associated peptidase [Gemmatimonadota bacterium]|nr:SOS response-associated peptidase [Gemmatimonadota bacterium]MDH3427493.1 SOS response-associated peptidase [Gemmatimonadota bacterium]
MCGRFTLVTPASEWAALFHVEPLDVDPRYNIAPTTDIVAVRHTTQRGARESALLRWGLIPAWTDTPDSFPLLINARSETIASKPSFGDAFRQRRCVAVADGFYEWQADGGRKRPFWIHLPDGSPFGIAAVWDRWSGGGSGPVLESCALVTTRASEDLEDVHDRMPVILDPGQVDKWLDSATGLDELEALMLPGRAGRLTRREVSSRVNSVRYDDEDCLAPVSVQSDLFG